MDLMILKMNLRIKKQHACRSCEPEGNCVLTTFIVSLIYYMHFIGLPRLGTVHFIQKTLRELILLPFSGDYFILILIM